MLLIKYLGLFCGKLLIYQLLAHKIKMVKGNSFFWGEEEENASDNIYFIHANEWPRYNWLHILC